MMIKAIVETSFVSLQLRYLVFTFSANIFIPPERNTQYIYIYIYIYTVTTFKYVEGGPDRQAPEVV
jgi:hypothetical protein